MKTTQLFAFFNIRNTSNIEQFQKAVENLDHTISKTNLRNLSIKIEKDETIGAEVSLIYARILAHSMYTLFSLVSKKD